jgi:uncharacterized protein (TIGR03086 family)
VDALTQLDVLVPTFDKVAAGTKVDQLDGQTPCAEWKVRDLFGHLLGGATIFAAMVRGDEPPSDVPSAEDRDLSSATRAAAAELDAAFRQAGALERIVPTPFGEMPGETFARLLAFDLLVHTWDLATATGQDLSVPAEVVAEVDAFARAAIAPEMRGPGTFGPELEPAPGATPLERLVAFAGRTV